MFCSRADVNDALDVLG